MSVSEQINYIIRKLHHPDGEPPVIFFDCDNCLYHRRSGVSEHMKKRIRAYFVKIGIPEDQAASLHKKYYSEYGLAIRGLIAHHSDKVDPVDYDLKVDGGLPLDELLRPDPQLRRMLETIPRGVKKWVFTNAGEAHARRCLRILGIDDLFDGITYCDYSKPGFHCKPELPYYEQAMQEAGVKDPRRCILIDDSLVNILAAREFGWHAVHVTDPVVTDDPRFVINTITDLPKALPELWETPSESEANTKTHPSTSDKNIRVDARVDSYMTGAGPAAKTEKVAAGY
ncbi:uncharacterized protein VTP21DRAFT_3863 [Calcarisporiella thermophila]|uniref:uncharacterized protein n=1 Tax=Calcarisporiella thermophila TaxID=911321 RepID=UPI003743AE57